MLNKLPWIKACAESVQNLKHGDQLLVVVRLAGRLCGGHPYLDFHVTEVQADGQGFVKFHSNGWNWEWSDVAYYLPLSDVDLPEDLK